MLKRKLGLLAAAAVMVGMFTSCVNVIKNDKGNEGSGDQTPTTQAPEIDYSNYTGSDMAIKVKNDSNQNVVCFKGVPSKETLLGGVRGHTTSGLKYNSSLFNDTADYILYAVTEDDYNKANGDDVALKELKNHPFAMLYAYYNKDSESNANMVYTISSHMGGEFYILLNNTTAYNVELRQNGLYGESLAFAGANTVQTKVNIGPGDYYIYPVFRRFSNRTKEIITGFPKEKDSNGNDVAVMTAFSLSEGEGGDCAQEFDVNQWFSNTLFQDSITPSSAYLNIKNANTGTGISLYKGSLAEITSTGGKMINKGKDLTFEIPMTDLGNKKYSSFKSIAGWQIGIPGTKVDIPSKDLYAGKMYYLEVSGSSASSISVNWKDIVDDVGFFDE